MMEYTEWPPGPELRPYIRCIWTLRSCSVGSAPERILPDASPEILFNFGDRFRHHRDDGTVAVQPSWFVVGQLSRAMLLATPARADVLGVRLRPEALPALFPVTAHELTARVIPVEDLLPAGDPAWDDLADAASAAQRVEAARTFLRRRVRAVSRELDPLVQEALGRIAGSGGTIRVRGLASAAGRSTRALERRVLAAVGLTPKAVARIVRLQRVVRLKRMHCHWSWAAVAHHCGYTDEAHLSGDFKRLAGVPPSIFFKETRALNDAFADGPDAAFVQGAPGASA